MLFDVLMLIYWIAGYWAVGETIDANKVFISSGGSYFLRRAGIGLIFGWVLIPVALIKRKF